MAARRPRRSSQRLGGPNGGASGERPIDPPAGLRYCGGILTEDEEGELLEAVCGLSFGEVRLYGMTAKRRVAHFGWIYEYVTRKLRRGAPLPAALLPLRARLSALAGLPPDAFEEALVTEYPPGAGIGWHRDAPMFGPVVLGVSLLGPARMRFRRAGAGPDLRSPARAALGLRARRSRPGRLAAQPASRADASLLHHLSHDPRVVSRDVIRRATLASGPAPGGR